MCAAPPPRSPSPHTALLSSVRKRKRALCVQIRFRGHGRTHRPRSFPGDDNISPECTRRTHATHKKHEQRETIGKFITEQATASVARTRSREAPNESGDLWRGVCSSGSASCANAFREYFSGNLCHASRDSRSFFFYTRKPGGANARRAIRAKDLFFFVL